ncbi:hypothetical protein CFBP498_50560 (plasmid) [Xanthomonas hortorum pv. vitians]|uniref:Uncharacterized protein n=1 Tax=Xanthomonas hortorum pv. vitians TaxID=83224 RepID=A0A6V7FM66_9XANT|nr:hypothetical protein CFBP498_50560 [Xanthomonas hortorum pv. vitians]CAD0364873.1 hypothetical protein CFBP498_50560 [Xanthomonas hortorum pv. vitians]
MPMSQNMRKPGSAVNLIQSRRGRDRKRSPAWGATHRCRVPRHRQSALILAPARSACRSKTAPRPARRFPTSAAMTSVARANARHPAPRRRCVLIVRFLRIDAALLIASMPRTSHGAAAVLGRILTRSHSLRSLALRLPGSPLHANLIRHAPDRCAINNPAPKGTHYEKTHASSPHNGAGKLAGHHHGPGDAGHSHRGAGRKTQLRRNGAKAPFFASLHPPRATAKHASADPHARRGRGRTRPPAWGAAHRCRVPRHRQSALILAPARSACRSAPASAAPISSVAPRLPTATGDQVDGTTWSPAAVGRTPRTSRGRAAIGRPAHP